MVDKKYMDKLRELAKKRSEDTLAKQDPKKAEAEVKAMREMVQDLVNKQDPPEERSEREYSEYMKDQPESKKLEALKAKKELNKMLHKKDLLK